MTSSDPPQDQQKTANKTQPADIKESIATIASSLDDFVKEYKTNNGNQDSTDHSKETWNRRTAKGVFIYTGLTAVILLINWCQLHTSQKTFDAAYRPYVGVKRFSIFYLRDGHDASDKWVADAQGMSFNAEIENFGPVPGEDYRAKWDVFIDGVRLPSTREGEDSSQTIFPSQTLGLTGDVRDNLYAAIRDGKKILTVNVRIDYRGPSDQYSYCTTSRYIPQMAAFNYLGGNCAVLERAENKDKKAN